MVMNGSMLERGFTLIEAMIAILLAAITVTTAAATYMACTDAIGSLTRSGAAWDESMTWRIWTAEALESAEVHAERDLYFLGSREVIEFHGWSLTETGRTLPATWSLHFEGGALRLQASSTPS